MSLETKLRELHDDDPLGGGCSNYFDVKRCKGDCLTLAHLRQAAALGMEEAADICDDVMGMKDAESICGHAIRAACEEVRRG